MFDGTRTTFRQSTARITRERAGTFSDTTDYGTFALLLCSDMKGTDYVKQLQRQSCLCYSLCFGIFLTHFYSIIHKVVLYEVPIARSPSWRNENEKSSICRSGSLLMTLESRKSFGWYRNEQSFSLFCTPSSYLDE